MSHKVHRHPSEQASDVSHAEKHEAAAEAEEREDKGQIKTEALPAVVPQSLVERSGDSATDETNGKTENPGPRWKLPRLSASAVLVACNAVLAIVAIFQLVALKGSSEQAGRLIAANETLAESAKQQASALDNQLRVMRDTLDQAKTSSEEASEQTGKLIAANEQLAKAAFAQANSGKTTADAAAKSAVIAEKAFIIGQRPSLGVIGIEVKTLEEKRQAVIRVAFRNSGNHTAYRTTSDVAVFVEDAAKGKADECPELNMVRRRLPELVSSATVPVNAIKFADGHTTVALTANNVAAIKEGKIWLFVWGRVEYFGPLSDKSYFFEYYGRYRPATGEFDLCTKHNDAN